MKDPTWAGMIDALYNIIQSAWKRYVNFGCDIGGYLAGSNGPMRDKELFFRWFQLGAMLPLMENGGNGEHRPWMYDAETETTYRLFVNIHYEIGPYLYNAGTTAYEHGTAVIFPLAEHTIFDPSTWDYLLWHDMLVCPIAQANTTSISVKFPVGDDWIFWFDNSKIYEGGMTYVIPTPLDTFPIFNRQGSMIPLHVTNKDNRHGSELSKDSITLLISQVTSKGASSAVREYGDKALAQEMHYEWDEQSGMFQFQATSHSRSLIILLSGVELCSPQISPVFLLDSENHPVLLKEYNSEEQLFEAKIGYWYNQNNHQLFIRPGTHCENGIDLKVSCLKNKKYPNP